MNGVKLIIYSKENKHIYFLAVASPILENNFFKNYATIIQTLTLIVPCTYYQGKYHFGTILLYNYNNE